VRYNAPTHLLLEGGLSVTTLRIDYPTELLADKPKAELEAIAREALLVRLYDLGEISSGKAAEILGISRREFLDILNQYKVSEFDENMDLEAEVRRG
jgi:predicted HTH domain antitoxin